MHRTLSAILACLVVATSSGLGADPTSPARFPAASNEDAWKNLPRENPPLPLWARVLAEPLPQTTGAMLELDLVHRAKNPLGPVLAGKLRWAAADAIGCACARRYAEADLRRAGLQEADLKRLTGDVRDLPSEDRLALGFARQMTLAAYEVSDEDFAAMLNHFGAERTVAIVHTLAYANFQNRVFLGLGIDEEDSDPLPPIDVPLDKQARAKVPTPERKLPGGIGQKDPSQPTIGLPDWAKREPVDLAEALRGQKERKARIPMPDAERVAKIPPEAKEQASKVVWTRVSMGYQPLLTKAWFDCMRTFQQEAKFDRVFSNSVFWVVTRSNECFY